MLVVAFENIQFEFYKTIWLHIKQASAFVGYGHT